MRIGKLDRRISIQRATESVNDYGERELSWSTAFVIWAALEIKRTGSSESITDNAQNTKQTAEWTIRHSSQAATITAADRIEYNGAIWSIVAVHELGRGVDIRLITEKIEL